MYLTQSLHLDSWVWQMRPSGRTFVRWSLERSLPLKRMRFVSVSQLVETISVLHEAWSPEWKFSAMHTLQQNCQPFRYKIHNLAFCTDYPMCPKVIKVSPSSCFPMLCTLTLLCAFQNLAMCQGHQLTLHCTNPFDISCTKTEHLIINLVEMHSCNNNPQTLKQIYLIRCFVVQYR